MKKVLLLVIVCIYCKEKSLGQESPKKYMHTDEAPKKYSPDKYATVTKRPPLLVDCNNIYIYNPCLQAVKVTIIDKDKKTQIISINSGTYATIPNEEYQTIISCPGNDNYCTGNIHPNSLYDLASDESVKCYCLKSSSILKYKTN